MRVSYLRVKLHMRGISLEGSQQFCATRGVLYVVLSAIY